jgi:hypothetical protein
VVGLSEPPGSVEVEALGDPPGAVGQLAGQRRLHLELGRGQHPPETELGGGLGHPRQREGVGLLGGHARQVGAVALQQRVAAVRAAVGVDRYPGRRERVHVPIDRADRDLELVGELTRGEASAALQQEQHGEQATGAHGSVVPHP